MAKQIIPHKAVIDFKEDGTYNDIIFQYRLLDDSGNLDPKIYSISGDSKISKPIINGILNSVKDFTHKTENKIKE